MQRAFSGCAVLLLCAATAFGSCGSSSCPIDINSLTTSVGHLVVDLSLQYVDQDRPRGTELTSPHEEIRTINRITNLQFSYAPTRSLRWLVTVPYLARTHEHIENATHDLERWNFSAPGDVAVQGRFRALEHLWLIGGVKLATGATNERDVTGAENAEVTIQPGSGSTDVTAGIGYENGVLRDTSLQGPLGHATLIPYFASVTYRVNGRGTNAYRRGNEAQINVGTQYPLSERIEVLAQINGRVLQKDAPGRTEENPDLTGGRFLYVSPGLRVQITDRLAAYAYVQVPLYQHVNGRQLTAKANDLIGLQHRF